jgi:glycosyltransferase involved in cell wall biosynthesis
MMRSLEIFDCADLSSEDHVFVALDTLNDRRIYWHRYSGLPKYAIERSIARPRLSRYRAAWSCAVQAAMRGNILISHLPLMSGALEATRLVGLRLPPHLAFAFNFTDLPRGKRQRFLQKCFAGIDQFCVYSRYECDLYSSFFDLPPSRFRATLWTQQPPRACPVPPTGRLRPFVAAVGAEGRDFSTLITTARRLPNIDFLIIVRSTARHAEALAAAPDNVQVKFDLPAEEVWGHACNANAVLVPLQSETTCCGHITIVSAQQLGIPVVTTRSHATREYTEDWESTLVAQPRDAGQMARAIETVVDEHEHFLLAAVRDKTRAIREYDRSLWVKYVADFIRSRS